MGISTFNLNYAEGLFYAGGGPWHVIFHAKHFVDTVHIRLWLLSSQPVHAFLVKPLIKMITLQSLWHIIIQQIASDKPTDLHYSFPVRLFHMTSAKSGGGKRRYLISPTMHNAFMLFWINLP